VDVGGHCASDRQPIGAGLFLPNAPPAMPSIRARKVCANDIGPQYARFDLEQTSIKIQAADAIEPTHVQQRASAQELLTTHCVPSASNGQPSPFRATS